MTDIDTLKKMGQLRAKLKEIADMSAIDISLDPDKPRRVAKQGLEQSK